MSFTSPSQNISYQIDCRIATDGLTVILDNNAADPGSNYPPIDCGQNTRLAAIQTSADIIASVFSFSGGISSGDSSTVTVAPMHTMDGTDVSMIVDASGDFVIANPQWFYSARFLLIKSNIALTVGAKLKLIVRPI